LSDDAKAEAASDLKNGYSTMKMKADGNKRGTVSKGGKRKEPSRAPMPPLPA
jgi:hypothetical protein